MSRSLVCGILALVLMAQVVLQSEPSTPALLHVVQASPRHSTDEKITPDFGISTNPQGLFMNESDTATANITITRISGFSAAISLTLAVSNMSFYTICPSGDLKMACGTFPTPGAPTDKLACSFSSPRIVLGRAQNAVLSCEGSRGTYFINVTARGDNVSHSTWIFAWVGLGCIPSFSSAVVCGTTGPMWSVITITSPPIGFYSDYTVVANFPTLTLNVGSSGSVPITITPIGGFRETLALSVNAPSELSCSLDHTTLRPSSPVSTVILTCSGEATGDYTAMVTASSGQGEKQTSVVVRVSSPISSPVPSRVTTILGFNPELFFAMAGGMVALIAMIGAVFFLRRKKR